MKLPRFEPMLATLWKDPFSDPEWLFEEKVDGFRTLVYWDGERTELRSRGGRDVTEMYPEVGRFTSRPPCVIDGEAVVRDEAGIPRFELMQQRTGPATARARELFPVEFVAFDLLFDDGDITALPLEERRSRLEALDVGTMPVVGDGLELWSRVQSARLEGMVAKRRDSRYVSGARSDAWRKIPFVRHVRCIVGGFTAGEGGRADTFGSLQMGLWTDEGLRWVGSVGTGFTDATLRAIRHALDQQIVDVCPFTDASQLPDAVTWVEPRLVAMVGIKEWTKVGRMRAPRFLGFTDDDPMSVTWEREGAGFT